MRFQYYFLILLAFAFIYCEVPKTHDEIVQEEEVENQLPHFTYDKSNLFPGDGSLLRAEDGVALADGRIIVVDQAQGLRLIEKDGSNRPFGDFASAGYVHNPPDQIAAPNGIFLEHDGQHILTSDVADGKIYRITIENESVEMIYDHPYGVNTIYKDKTGAIWFSQSTKSTNMTELFNDVNLPVPHGAVFRMKDPQSAPEKIVDSLYFSNGITMDEAENYLFIAETMMDRVHAVEVDINNGTTKYMGVAANVGTPDNILLDKKGRLLVASPIHNQVLVIDFQNHSKHIIFDGSSDTGKEITQEWVRRSHLGEPRLELLSPDLFDPLPGLITGMFFSHDGKTLYITNLGNDLLKYDWE